MESTLVLNVVGLSGKLLRHAPRLQALASAGGMRTLTTITPAVTAPITTGAWAA